MKRQPLTYRDAKRIGQPTLPLSMWRVWWGFAWTQIDDRDIRRAIHSAWSVGGGDKSLVTVHLTEAEAKRVIEVTRERDRLNTADALDGALRLAKAKQEKDGGKAAMREAFAQLAADGELTADEIEAGRRKGLL